MVRVVVVYDISDDNKRLRLANKLKYLGLSRIQKSAFSGRLDSSRIKDLYRICKEYATDTNDIIHVFQICGYDWSRRKVFGKYSEVTENVVLV